MFNIDKTYLSTFGQKRLYYMSLHLALRYAIIETGVT